MKANKHLPWLSSGILLAAIPFSGLHAAATVRGACSNEIQKFSCDAKSDAYAYACLNQHKDEQILNRGFSPKCFKAYASYEKASGKGERLESHQTERVEHSN